MSEASSSRRSGSTRARCSSTSGRRPAFHASMKSLRMRSGSRGTEDPLQFLQAAAAALVDVVGADLQALCDRRGVEPAALAARIPRLVEAAAAAPGVAQLLAPIVEAGVVDDAVHGGLVLAEL